MSHQALAAVALLGQLLVAPGAAAAEAPPPTPPRRLAVVPFYAPEQMWRAYAPLVAYLRRETGEPWELALHPTHDALLDAICAGRVDVALLGPIPLGRANHRCGAVPVLVALGPGGASTYRSVLLTTDAAVTSVAGLRGKVVGIFRGSTAAHVVPLGLLADAGLPPGSYRTVDLESQDRLVAALLAGRISAAGVKSALHLRLQGEPGLRVLTTSAPLPNFAFVALPSRPASLEPFRSALLRLRPLERPADAEAVRDWDDEVRHGFVRPGDDFLPAVRALRGLAERTLDGAR